MAKFILKQNGSAPKHLSHMGKFDNSEDLIYHIQSLKKRWNEAEFGEIDFDLMEIVEGLEVAASAFFNGHDWLKNKEGKITGFVTFEEKKETDGGMGQVTGETGTTCIGVTEDNALFKDIILRPKITEVLRAIKYKGIFDINCIKTKEGLVALEATCRFGIPTTSYEFMEGLKSSAGELIEIVAKGEDKPIEILQGVGMIIVVTAKPFPVEFDIDDEGTSIGEKLWILDNGKPVDEFSKEQLKHIHLQNFYKSDTGFHVATKNGYLLVVSGIGKSIGEAREKLLEYIKQNLYISGMKFRTDIGKRVEDYAGIKSEVGNDFMVSLVENVKSQYEIKLDENKTKLENVRGMYEQLLVKEKAKSEELVKNYEEKLAEEKIKVEEELNKIKQLMKEAIYYE